MTREDAIKYLRQIYPNGGHCWLDEQRIEAINMAIQALSVSLPEGVEEAASKYISTYYANHHQEPDMTSLFIAGAEWQKKKDDELLTIAYMDGVADGKAKMMEEAVEGKVIDNGSSGTTIDTKYGVLYLPPLVYAVDDKLKVIIVKEDKK